MTRGRLKARLRAGELVVGTMVFEFATTGIARLAAAAGAEFVIYDMEHSGWSAETIRMLLASSGGADLAPVVRVPGAEYHLIAPVLDLGAEAVMVPMVEDADAAQHLVSCSRYPPEGKRGAAFGIAHDDYTGGDIGEKVRRANEEIVTIAQIETPRGVENADSIAGVEGIDVLFLGQFDLTSFLGVPGSFDDERFLDAVERVKRAATSHGKALGVLAMDPNEAVRWTEAGFTMIAYGGDLWLYRKALSQGLAAVRATPPRP